MNQYYSIDPRQQNGKVVNQNKPRNNNESYHTNDSRMSYSQEQGSILNSRGEKDKSVEDFENDEENGDESEEEYEEEEDQQEEEDEEEKWNQSNLLGNQQQYTSTGPHGFHGNQNYLNYYNQQNIEKSMQSVMNMQDLSIEIDPQVI